MDLRSVRERVRRGLGNVWLMNPNVLNLDVSYSTSDNFIPQMHTMRPWYDVSDPVLGRILQLWAPIVREIRW